MPLYEYLCEACGKRFDLIQKFLDPAPEACPKCGKGPVERQQSSPAIQFKGSGWYITDYARKGGGSGGDDSKPAAAESSSTSSGEGSGDSKKGDSKEGDSKKGESKKAEATPAATTSSTTPEKS